MEGCSRAHDVTEHRVACRVREKRHSYDERLQRRVNGHKAGPIIRAYIRLPRQEQRQGDLLEPLGTACAESSHPLVVPVRSSQDMLQPFHEQVGNLQRREIRPAVNMLKHCAVVGIVVERAEELACVVAGEVCGGHARVAHKANCCQDSLRGEGADAECAQANKRLEGTAPPLQDGHEDGVADGVASREAQHEYQTQSQLVRGRPHHRWHPLGTRREDSALTYTALGQLPHPAPVLLSVCGEL
mmetsp:Transcript_75644/g.200948  ORF Transcript_75644/g.200948 Transcript_75644/m.200948 type:complete len:243 (-) Transcript_75644:533-1261(-)